jgi:hypothetical protein
MGGGGHHDLGPRPDPFKDPFGGLRVPKISQVHKRMATAFGALTTFWVLFRVKQDGSEIFLVRHHIQSTNEFDFCFNQKKKKKIGSPKNFPAEAWRRLIL